MCEDKIHHHSYTNVKYKLNHTILISDSVKDLAKSGFDAHINQTHFSPLVPKFLQSAFPVACFWGLSDIHKCLGGL